ncbi:acyl-CoA dehydrogenase family protein [Simiduia sp. 21SJ11W-1]|uniref:acyl-CoA dehydrogenase family protein n=1 Tax=Simiduia sp. 21SJ11W-1 TaxID=2909669 RepID=UPI0020A0C3BC|nr:acyl-CoA dehydrogenase family protein [Simiduia sp. 21SJ11W-1]UTA46410.1 acyl-CoA dehydrogenase family protein [Simiduia sp. 21SJ11W-1]
MQFSEQHQALRQNVARFVSEQLNPHIEQWEREGQFPMHALLKSLANLGLLGISKPETAGGLGLDFSYELILAEELGAAHCGGVPLAIGVQTSMATPALAQYGSDALKQHFLQPAIAGDMVAAIAVSEPGAGSDVANVKTHARKDGGDYIINGSKMWITNAHQADFFCVLANTGDGKPHENKSLIIVPATLSGVTLGPKLEKMGMRSSDTSAVFFDDVRVPIHYRIGEEGAGFLYQMLQFQEERLFGAALTLKGFELCIQSTIEYTREREAFGHPLINNQTIHFALAELQTEVEALRSLIYRATENYVTGQDATQLASMAKLKAGRLSRTLPDQCLQFWGGMGFMEASLINRLYRDFRLTSIGGGADEIMLGIICKLMGILPKRKKA